MTRLGKELQPARPAKSRRRQQPVSVSARLKDTPRRPATRRSKRLVCPKHVMDEALGLFGGNPKAAEKWLSWPAAHFGWKTPLEMAQTEEGAEEVIHLIGRISYGTLA